MPQAAPPAHEQVLTEKLQKCGLRKGDFTVRYEEELRSIEIVIARKTEVPESHFKCIAQSAGSEIVTFEDLQAGQVYDQYSFEARKPELLADARAKLAEHNALIGFPKRANFNSDKLFADALERQCGVKPGSFFVQSHGDLIAQFKPDGLSQADENRISCLMAAVMFAAAYGENFKFGFIGNEAVAPEP